MHPVVEGYIETIKELGIDTYIEFISLLVSWISCCHLSEICASELRVPTAVEWICTTAGGILLSVVCPNVVAWQIVGIDDTCRGAELQEVYPVYVLHNLLLRDNPCCREGGREGPFCTRSQTAAAAVYKCKVYQITAVVAIV